MDDTKTCCRCKKELPRTLEYFGRDKRKKDGLLYACRVCLGGKYTKQPKEGYKFCSKCNKELPATLEYFNSRPEIPSGLSSNCKECKNSYSKQYQKDNKENIKKYRDEYYEKRKNDPEFKVKRIKWSKAWRVANPEKVKTYKKQYREENKGAIKEYMDEYHEKNREYNKIRCKEYNEKNKEYISQQRRQHYIENREEMIARQHRRYAKIKELKNTLTVEEWECSLEYFNNSCAYCGMTEEENYKNFGKALEQDHFIPLSKNGEYTKENIIPACRSCNASKCDNDFLEWYIEQGFYSEEREKNIINYIEFMEEDNYERSYA
jgi:hypothetical protein